MNATVRHDPDNNRYMVERGSETLTFYFYQPNVSRDNWQHHTFARVKAQHFADQANMVGK